MGCGGSTGKRSLNEDAKAKLEELFGKMDHDGSGTITKEEAQKFFTSFSKVNTKAFFDEVDEDSNGCISKAEFMGFWSQVRAAGYSNEQILEELEELTSGSGWVNWKDSKDVAVDSKSGAQKEYKPITAKQPEAAGAAAEPAAATEPAEPAAAEPAAAEPAAAEPAAAEPAEAAADTGAEPSDTKISDELLGKLEEMFTKIDSDGSNTITKEEAMKFFTSFGKVNANAMFAEVDDDGNGRISKEEFMGFWQQVRTSGYSNDEIAMELEELVKGGAWVNWDDGKQVPDD
ncbi:unnamed protein product [Durusdinium trenchii]|uniref:EF-hand domain-containing protein n=2 Tax=Durusdinium trenchii TaxID=1381693 RepID=A0ABP0QTC0_9DINO